MGIIDVLLQRFDIFMNRIQGFQPTIGRSQNYRMQSFSQPRKPPKAALFGSDFEDPFGFGYSAIRSSPAPVVGAINPAAPRYERENLDGEIDLEKWKPNPDIPSLVSHGKQLNYSNVMDQKPVLTFTGETSDVWDGIVRVDQKPSGFQSVRGKREPTIADKHAEDLKHLGFDFSV